MKGIIAIVAFLGIWNCYGQNEDLINQRIQALPDKEYLSLETLYNDIVLPRYSETEKVRAIGMWIVYHIAYDATYTHSKTPLETLKRRMGVCQSYAEFFKALCDLGGIECQVIQGAGRNHESHIGMPVRTNHAWNAVKIDDKNYLFDLAWAAGYVNGDEFTQRFNSRYFMAPPGQFIVDHFPVDAKWQLLEKPLSKEEFISWPFIEDAYFSLGIKNLTPFSGIIRSDTVRIIFQSNQEVNSAMLIKYSLNAYGYAYGEDLEINKNGDNYELVYVPKKSGAYRFSIFLNDLYAFCYKVVTPGFKPAPPSQWSLDNPHELIEVYYYLFYAFDKDLFAQLNPGTDIKDLSAIPMANELKSAMTGWFGDFERYYIEGPGDIATIEIEEFEVVLKKAGADYVFKEIKKKAS